MNEAATLAVANESLSIISLIIHASLLVQIVMLILVVASLASWIFIFTKASSFKSLREEADRFDLEFVSADLGGVELGVDVDFDCSLIITASP